MACHLGAAIRGAHWSERSRSKKEKFWVCTWCEAYVWDWDFNDLYTPAGWVIFGCDGPVSSYVERKQVASSNIRYNFYLHDIAVGLEKDMS